MKRSGLNTSASSPQYSAAMYVKVNLTDLVQDEADSRFMCNPHTSKETRLPAGTAIVNFPVSTGLSPFDPGLK